MSEKEIPNIELIIDNEDTYQENEDVFYIHPSRIPLLNCVNKSQFSSCTIKNSPLSSLSGINFMAILGTLRQNAKVEVIIDQPISVMQEYDAKQVEANAKLAGFDEVSINETTFVDSKTQNKRRTLAVNFIKPVKNPNAVDIVVTVEVKGKSKSNKAKK